ncbi:peptidase P60 [Campylobacter sp. MIT 12-8780]|nr:MULTISPECIES: NlpC/P60 family protein [unclassified Campylobacter]NDJ27232.1 hypothetical protein [Campylobacter sp. MIT 19-121]TQR41476.1 peptidase P60 [Campylobacter sp. MIT 12-8780]
MKILQFVFIVSLSFFISACFSSYSSYKTQRGVNATPSKLESIRKEWQRTPYRLGGVSKKGADCSGFTQSVLSQHFRTQIPRTTALQMKSGQKISRRNLRAGDLVFFRTGRGPNGLHVGIYVKNNNFIHLSPRGGAREGSLNSSYWKPKYLGARRYIK